VDLRNSPRPIILFFLLEAVLRNGRFSISAAGPYPVARVVLILFPSLRLVVRLLSSFFRSKVRAFVS